MSPQLSRAHPVKPAGSEPGLAAFALRGMFAAVTVVQALRGEILVLGYASLIVSLWLLSGLMIFIIGVVGLYVGKCFEGVKRRPPFIISQEIQGGAGGEK